MRMKNFVAITVCTAVLAGVLTPRPTYAREISTEDVLDVIEVTTEELTEEVTEDVTEEVTEALTTEAITEELTTETITEELTEEEQVLAAEGANAQQTAYLTRLYQECMGRKPDVGGLTYWSNELSSGRKDGFEVAYFFFHCKEYTGKKRSNENYIKDLYRVCMDRKPDAEGLAYWKDTLKATSYDNVLYQFLGCEEYIKLCTKYAITHIRPGHQIPSRYLNSAYNAIVTSMYRTILNREPDEAGLETHCAALLNHRITIDQLNYNWLFHETEFLKRRTTDEEFIAILYKTYYRMDPSADPAGYKKWVTTLKPTIPVYANEYTLEPFRYRAQNRRCDCFYAFVSSAQFNNFLHIYDPRITITYVQPERIYFDYEYIKKAVIEEIKATYPNVVISTDYREMLQGSYITTQQGVPIVKSGTLMVCQTRKRLKILWAALSVTVSAETVRLTLTVQE